MANMSNPDGARQIADIWGRTKAPLEADPAGRHPALEQLGARLRALAEAHDPDGVIRAQFRAEHPEKPRRLKSELPKRGPGKNRRKRR